MNCRTARVKILNIKCAGESHMEEPIRYERAITLRTIYLTLIRRTEMILIIFLPLVLISYIVTNFAITKTYASSTTFNNGVAISQANYSAMELAMTKAEIYEDTATNLKAAGVKHANGSAIAAAEIKSGLSFAAYSNNMVSFQVTFSSSDSSICQKTLAEYADVALASISETYQTLSIYSTASTATKTSSENKYFLVGVAISAILALGVPFIVEIVLDQVYERKDIEAFGANAFEIYASGK